MLQIAQDQTKQPLHEISKAPWRVLLRNLQAFLLSLSGSPDYNESNNLGELKFNLLIRVAE